MVKNSEGPDKVGIYIATALVVGNMIGSGIFLLPSSLAGYGGISLIGWLLSGLGAIVLAIVFSRLSKLLPKTGGPYVYSRKAYGDFSGFLVGWGYWISTLATNAAIAVAFSGYLTVFVPALEGNNIGLAGVAIASIWFLTWLNSRGVKSGGVLQLLTTVLKIVPLIVISIAGLFFFESSHFWPLNLSGESDLHAIAATLTITLFAFLGIEAATIPADNIHEPEKTIPKATVIGTLITIAVYMISSVSIMGIISPDELARSSAPFADAAGMIWGDTGRYLIGFGALISTFGALNGWLLIQGQVPFAMAKDSLFPPIFKKTSKRNYPLIGMLMSSLLVSIVVLSNFTKGLVGMFTFLILLSTFTVLIAYLFSSLAEILILSKTKPENWDKRIKRSIVVSLLAFLFSIWAIYGSGQEIVFYGFMALALGTPFYAWSKIEQARALKSNDN